MLNSTVAIRHLISSTDILDGIELFCVVCGLQVIKVKRELLTVLFFLIFIMELIMRWGRLGYRNPVLWIQGDTMICHKTGGSLTRNVQKCTFKHQSNRQ